MASSTDRTELLWPRARKRRSPPPTPAPPEEAGIGGWATFAAIVLFLSGMFSGLYGLAAVLNDKVVTVGGGGVIVWDFTTWGWVHMGLAAVMIATSLALFAGRNWARWTAVVLCILNAILQLHHHHGLPDLVAGCDRPGHDGDVPAHGELDAQGERVEADP